MESTSNDRLALADGGDLTNRLNRDCFCVTLERSALQATLARDLGDPTFAGELADARPHLFSNVSVFVSDERLAQMQRVVRLIEGIANSQVYWDAAARWAPDIALEDPGPAGAFMGYDFHLGETGPKLIEINTNAGGAILNAVLAQAQSECCGVEAAARPGFPGAELEARVCAMFLEEWRRQRGDRPLRRIAVVDDNPQEQYLYPEFVLAQTWLQRAGFEAVIADPSELSWRDGGLFHEARPIDLIYNRLVDFALAQPKHSAINSAYVAGEVVVTPNPHLHARFADKRNLTLLSDRASLEAFGVRAKDVELLTASVPGTVIVTPENAAELWASRRDYFFKPERGYGSKASYRGAKLTRSVWVDVAKGGYVAQRFAPPSERMIRINGVVEPRKMDVRLYTYGGEMLLAAARLYKGQTTNFRTEGGGFAPVLRTRADEFCATWPKME
ncbi:MAG: hypothetical protein JHD15_07490 [Phenylobacterium sp.]|jgi:hypothetical protein|uniref:hypothetical protein n=1 Tax=Phenylobacterium sp. TaxID=1871053 RepID=UPI001A1B908B|nr:hypothetical protein [Phenylobacterium sp.]MBJ7410194.1 hypothetical protein [Phenylobacterium sp.]